MNITLNWPSPALSPNARVHWSVKARAAKKYRADAHLLCKAAKIGKVKSEMVHLSIVACPPDNRARDADNLMSQLKNCFDGIADAIGVNDKHFTSNFDWGSPVKYGAINIEITWR